MLVLNLLPLFKILTWFVKFICVKVLKNSLRTFVSSHKLLKNIKATEISLNKVKIWWLWLHTWTTFIPSSLQHNDKKPTKIQCYFQLYVSTDIYIALIFGRFTTCCLIHRHIPGDILLKPGKVCWAYKPSHWRQSTPGQIWLNAWETPPLGWGWPNQFYLFIIYVFHDCRKLLMDQVSY